jgi:hypothetical protein
MRVEASPEKQFFISMLIRDIELIPAIVDLVDNCVDGARSVAKTGDFSGLWVRLVVTEDEFSISDNCGGIEAEVARKYAFRFGRPEGFRGVEASVGQFGVGMKRALFKLGDWFEVDSTARHSNFRIEVDVKEWADDKAPDWSFKFAQVEEGISTKKAARGTRIVVKQLHPQVTEDLARNEVIGRLAAQLSLQHQSALAGGLAISVNARELEPTIPKLLQSRTIRPINRALRIEAEGGEVEARVIAGIAAPRERDERRDDAQAEEFQEPSEAGWYFFCNERLVLAADRTELTGWGRSTAAYHPQYRRFRGYAFLHARDSSLLPWNTTKTGLDQDSPIFRALQQAMFAALAAVASVLNRQKSEVQTRAEDDRPLTSALEQAREVVLETLQESQTFVVPPPPPTPRRTPASLVNVLYQVPRADMNRAMDFTGLSSAARVGQMTFEYFLETEVDAADA